MADQVAGLAAVVLAGGQSRRMGQPKAWLPIGGETFLQRIVRTVSRAAAEIVVVAAPGQQLPELGALATVVCDSIEGGGPLIGLETGWRAVRGPCEQLFACGCDTPLLTPEFIRCVARACVGREAAVPAVDGRRQPLAACYAFDLLPRLSTLIATGERSLQAFLDGLEMYELHADELSTVDPRGGALVNINTPEDWASWREQMAAASPDD